MKDTYTGSLRQRPGCHECVSIAKNPHSDGPYKSFRLGLVGRRPRFTFSVMTIQSRHLCRIRYRMTFTEKTPSRIYLSLVLYRRQFLSSGSNAPQRYRTRRTLRDSKKPRTCRCSIRTCAPYKGIQPNTLAQARILIIMRFTSLDFFVFLTLPMTEARDAA